MKKKIIALVLCLTLMAGIAIPGTLAVGLDTAESSSEMSVAASAETASVFFEQEYANTVSVPVDGKIVLSVGCTAEILGAQWQIYAPTAGVWANIYGETGSSCAVSYAMIRSMLDGDGLAKIRCLVSVADGTAVTQEVSLGVDTSAVPAQNEAPAAEPPVVLSDTVVTANTAEAPAAAAAPAMFSLPQNDEPSGEEPAGEEPAGEEPAGEEPAGDDSAPLNEPAPTGEESHSTYNVVINYLFENGEIVADPYTATLAAGSNFSATVIFPTVQGYLPYVGEATESTTSMDLNITNIQEDVTHTVVYKPTNVDYTVIHYQQNLNDDNYTEVAREPGQGLTNSQVPEVAKTYDGFYSLLYERPNIAADGSTVVEVYYDRNYYLMNFDLDGGYGVEPIYARYGTPISAVGTPTKAGYNFSGWTLNGSAAEIPAAMPAENRTYKAVWTADATAKVTVVFWGENADDEEYSYIKSSTVNVKPGTEFTYSESGALICALEVHTHDARCYTLTCTQEVHTHSESCYTCGQESHTHDTSCYDGVGSAGSPSLAPDNPSNGQIYRGWLPFIGSWSYIYINGVWYNYSGNLSDGEIASPTCGKTESTHTHTDACLGCGKTEHAHSIENGCYQLTCTKTEHTHTSDCYMNGAGLDSNLWKFVRSDTITVAADGSSVVNVYYDRTEKTLTFKYDYKNRNYQSTETITAKWGADISEQYKEIAANAGSTFWAAKDSSDGPYTNYFGIMPQASATYYNRGKTGSDGTMTYWGQDQNGDYTVKLFEVTGVGGYYVSDEDRYEFEGFTYHHGTSNNSSCSGAAFYYTRNSYTLTFNDGYNGVKSENVLYEAPLSTYSSYVPDVPSAYEPGSVTFGGWYLNPECTGAEYKLNDHTMPADNVLLYAKWVPVTHTVQFYLDKDALEEGTKLSTHPELTVSHGSLVDPAPAAPTNGSYTFIGWFYMENGVEKAFDFANMSVTKDLKVYGKWSSNVLKQYTVYYKIQGTDTQIADPTTGSGLAGVTKTFEAKGGSELYAGYQEGYFPLTKSHSLTLDINATEENDTNVYTFWYVQKEAVPYTVKYLNAKTGEAVYTEKTVSDNCKAVVTETFVPVSGMMPDAYQKRLVVSAEEGAVNEIIFYYTQDTTHAYYKITHYTQNTDGKTWTEYASSQAVGDIGTTYTADPMTIPGFTYDSTVEGTVTSGKLTANGLELKLYYTRNSYPYQVRYLEQGSGKQLADPKNDTGKYGQVISENAIDIANYDAVDPTSQTLNIRIEKGTEAKLNIITFYYKEKEVTINYQVVGPDGASNFGSVSPTSETLKVLSGDAQGSTATAKENFRFVGWFKDAGCTQAVDASWVEENKLTPVKATDAVWTKATYYAKFEYNLTTLTITKTITKSGGNENDSFIFDVQNKKSGEKFTVSVKGNSSVTIAGLKVGETYTVTERGSWSWRYKAEKQEQEIVLQPTDNNVTVTNSLDKLFLLDGSDYKQNNAVLYNKGTAGN